MNSNEIFDLIEQVARTPGKNDKIALLKNSAGDEMLKQVMAAAYNPLTSYGIRKVPEQNHEAVRGGREFVELTWQLVSDMAARKLTGHAMLAAVQDEMNELAPKSAELLKRIILKDMRAGFDEGTVAKVWPGLVPDFPYMRCCLPKDAKMEAWPWADGNISQEKADGMFANVNHEEGGNVFIYSRQGTMFPMEKFEALADAVRHALARGTQNHGEILVLRDGQVLAREIGNGIMNSVLKGGDFGPGEVPMFLVWDQIPLAAVQPKGKVDTPYAARLAGLIQQLRRVPGSGAVQLIPTRIVRSLEDAYKHYGELLAQGKEGTIIKNRNAIWKDGTSKEQVKLKLEFEVDLEVTAIVPGNANTKNAGRAGSLSCETSDGLLVVDVAIKGEAMRDDVDANPDSWIGKIMPVTANMIMKPSASGDMHSLFLPRFTQATPRADKTVADTLPRALAIEDAAKQGKKIADDWKEAA
jgi:DNA ligase-1